MAFDTSEADRFLSLLGKNGATRLRAFYPKKTPLPEDAPRAFKASYAEASAVLPDWQARGLGIYAVIGNGGDNDADITSCPALFIEWDDRPKAEQLIGWQTYGLPEPTLMVDTGGKSIHIYWVLTEPITPEQWRALTARLIHHTGADPTNRNPSRVMRLPGAWHFTYNPDANQIQPNAQATIVAAAGHRYDADTFDQLLPLLPDDTPAPPTGIPLDTATSGPLPPRPITDLYDALTCVPEFHHSQGRYHELLGLAQRLHIELGRAEALSLLRHHSPHVKDMAGYFNTTPAQISPGSIWPFLREHYGVDIRRTDLKGRAPISLNAAAATAQQPGTDADAAAPRRSELLATALDAAEADDEDTYAEVMADLMGRFRMSGSHVQAQLFRLLTTRRADGVKPKPGTVNIAEADLLEHRLAGFIPANEQALLFAPRGAGKTIAALAISRAITTGTPLLDQGTSPTPGRVLYLATDSGCASMHVQMQEMGLLSLPQFQHGHPDQAFFIRGHDKTQAVSAWEATITEVLWLVRFVQQENIDLVIIDSAKACLALTDTDYTDNRAVGALLTLFQRVVCPHAAVLWLNHDGRENGHNAGAKAWSEIPVMVHRIEKVEQPKPGPRGSGEDDQGQVPKNARKWICVKSRIGMDERDFIYALNAEGELVVSDQVEVVGNCREGVLQALRRASEGGQASMHRTDLLSAVMGRYGRSSRSVENTLAQMTRGKAPELIRPKRGHYSLAPRTRQLMEPDESLTARPVSLTEEVQGKKSLRGWGIDGGGNSQTHSSAVDLTTPQSSPDGGNGGNSTSPMGEYWGKPKPTAAQGERPFPPPMPPHTSSAAPEKVDDLTRLEYASMRTPGASEPETVDALTRLEYAPRRTPGDQPPETDHAASKPLPSWLPQLIALRQQQPHAAAASLALALDPSGTGQPSGREVKDWLPTADQLIAEGEEPSGS